MENEFILPLMGLNFRPAEAKAVVDELEFRERVYLEAEPDNEYDSNAVKVIAKDVFIGYLPKGDMGASIAGALAKDVPYKAEVSGWAGTRKPFIKVMLD